MYEHKHLSGVGDDSIIGATSNGPSATPMITNDTVMQYAASPELPNVPVMEETTDEAVPYEGPSLFSIGDSQSPSDIITPPLAPAGTQTNVVPSVAKKSSSMNWPLVILGASIVGLFIFSSTKNKSKTELTAQPA